MIRRLTALLAMIALLGLLATLIWQVQEHHRRGYGGRETRMVVNFAPTPSLISRS